LINVSMDVVTLGEAMLRFSPPLGESLESAPVLQVDLGGAESNVAVALARLGLSVGWISRLPNNALGRRAEGQIRYHRVDTSRVIWASGERMGAYYIEPGRSPRPTDVIYDRAHSAFGRIEPEEVDWAYVRESAWLHLTGITPALGEGARRTVERALREAASSSAIISFDVNYRSKLWSPEQAATVLTPLLSQVTIIQCAARDAALLFSTPTAGMEAARALYECFHPRLVVLTEGEAGAVAYDGTEYRIPPIPADTVDPIGSGDAFAAGFIVGYREGGVTQGLAWASALAAIKRTYRGDLPWTSRDQVRAVLDGAGINIVR
jgi:2-dehydro-3-deoxygluconokinase